MKTKNLFFSASNFSVIRQSRNSVFVEENNVITQYRRVENRPVPVNRVVRRRSASAPPAPIFPATPEYVNQVELLPRTRLSIEQLTENQVAQMQDKVKRDGLIAKIDLPARSCKCFGDLLNTVSLVNFF